MSGARTHTDAANRERRRFLKQLLGLTAMPLVAGMGGCAPADKYAHITGSIVGANHSTGHLLRDAHRFPAPVRSIDTDVLIVGGGISGLSARRWLQQHSVDKVLLLEMDERAGGNSVSGQNKVSAYPWGAHYMPIPDVANKELLDFLQEAGTITGYNAQGLPTYNEYHLCHDPEERLYIQGTWQEGLVPNVGISAADRQQIARFFAEVEELKKMNGSDGLPVFAIPLQRSSADAAWRKLDSISFARYLDDKGYTSPALRWYLEYCCKDDYGATLGDTSAWAGLHYFASRRGAAANADASGVLTWPQGNAWLMNKLRQHAGGDILTSMLAYKVILADSGVQVLCYDVQHKTTVAINCSKVLMATPQYVNRHLLAGLDNDREGVYGQLQYAPWMVANVTVTQLLHASGFPLCWDNVIYGRDSVGYVFANHQDLAHNGPGVLTFYLPLTGEATTARTLARARSYRQWLEAVITELEYAHPGITHCITHADMWIWGHGMVRPSPGYVWGSQRARALEPIGDKIFFAHTDLSGVSIFEEGFYQGIRAAGEILHTS